MSMGAVGDQFTDINVTPLTDVFLVLLVIMILIAPLIDKSDLKIKPPETKNAKKDEATKGISFDIDKDGQLGQRHAEPDQPTRGDDGLPEG